MEKAKKLTDLIADLEKMAALETCLTCQCFTDTLMEFKDVLAKGQGSQEAKERLEGIIRQATVTHNCLGCDPCLPVPVSNALSEILGSAVSCSCGPAGGPASIGFVKEARTWPVEQGEYVLGTQTSSVAISTLGSDDLPEALAAKLGKGGFAVVGKTHTENIGVEKIVKNIITNPNIRFLILCGMDTKGHMPGQSLVSLKANGVDHERKIIGSKGRRPSLKNLDPSEIEHFRAQVLVIDLAGTEETETIAQQALLSAEKNFGKFDKTVAIRKAPHVEAREPARLILDTSGFFIIYPKKEEGQIYLEHYMTDGTLNEIIYGSDPALIASTAVERGLITLLDHAAYLGKELEKAYLSMHYGFPYIQDRAPGNDEDPGGND